MDDNLARREAARPRRMSVAAELGANVSLQDGEGMEVHPSRETHPGSDRLGASGGRMERRNSLQQNIHQRHMPIDPLKFHIPRKTKEKRAQLQSVSTESREYEDMMTILNSSYIDTSSAGCFTYSTPRLVHSELLEKEFVEKRKEMKADGRTDKELEESYCFLLAETVKLPWLCEKGLLVGHSRVTVLGNPLKGVYLSRYSDLLQINPITPGVTGEIIIFKVMKGKVKSIYENMKNLLDPTPRFDSHISKNASKVTSVNSYRAFELTQQYFYEYSFDELRQRPRQVCPYAVVSFQFNGKDAPLPSKPLAPIRLNSQSADGSKERAQFTVWTGDLVKGDRVLYQISLRSFSPPFLPHRLPEKLEIGCVMRLDKVTKLLPSELFSYNLYSSSQEVVKSSHCCSLLEVTDRSRSTTSVTKLLLELEKNRVVLVTPLTEKGFLFIISSVQMATPPEREESWKRCLQALFIFPESRDVTKSTSRPASTSQDASEPSMSGGQVMPRLSKFIPALHHALVKARANPPPELSAGVERQAREYLAGLKDGKARHYPMGEYDSKLEEEGKPAPKHHRVNMDSYLLSYLYSPALYLLSVARARQMVEAHCGPDEPSEVRLRKPGQRETAGKEASSNTREGKTNSEKMQQLIDLVMTCKRNAENEVKREEAGGVKAPGRKRRMEQQTAERALKFLKASQEPGRHSRIPVEGNRVPASPGSLASVIGSVGLKDVDLSEDGSELATKLLSLLTGLDQAARGMASQSPGEVQEAGQRESYPFDRLATKLGLPTNCDIDLRRQDELEEQTAGSVSSLEGFSPGSHSGEMNHHGAAGGYEEVEEQWEIPWILIPITGLCSERYTQRDRNIPQDPRFQHLITATNIPTTTKPPRKSTTPSPVSSPPPSPSLCPSPDPSPPPSPSQCPSPEPSPPASPSQCPSPEPSPPPSPSHSTSPQLHHPPPHAWFQPPEPNELSLFNKDHSGANEELIDQTASRESTGVSTAREEKPQGKEEKTLEHYISSSIHPSITPIPQRRRSLSPPPAGREKDKAEAETLEIKQVELLMEERETPGESVQKREEGKQDEEKDEEEVEMMQVETSDKEQKGEVKELTGRSLFSLCISSPPPGPLKGIDNIVDKNLGDFSSEIQLLLQEESINYSCPQSPHSTSNTETTALPYAPISQFSQYVSFYNPCPPVHDYISSLQDSMDSMLTEFDESWPKHKPATSRTNADVALASTVSAFVSSIRAANASTDRDDDELAAADSGSEVWQPLMITKQFPDEENNRNSPTIHVTLSDSTSASGSGVKPTSTTVLHPPPQPSDISEITRTVANDLRETQDNSTTTTVHCTSSVEGTNYEVLDLSGPSKSLTEPPNSSEPVSSPASESVSGPTTSPPATALSSLISQLQPEVFKSLVEIIKDVKRNSLQFYLHSSEPGDPVHEGVKEQLLKQGNVQQSPVAFLNQDNSDNRLLVIIKNKDISGHVHKIPELVSLKRHSSVVFMGIDTPDDVRNNSFNELFISGGCIVSDELVLNPDYITHDRLAALLLFLEQHSSLECVWRWKVHYKTHRKLKEQARFRRDAATLLDVLSAYQKRQIVEFLPYHHCDMMNHQSPDLPCLLELQARYTQFRHTVFLTERQSEKFPAYLDAGIIVASIDEILKDFPRLVGDHDNGEKQPIVDDVLAPKDLIHPVSSHDQPHNPLHQSGSGLPPLSHLSDQLVPDASCKDGVPLQSGPDFEVLRQAISQLRAERKAQLQQLQQLQQQRLDSKPLQRFQPNPAPTGSCHSSTDLAPTESDKVAPGKKAVAATLEFIHSALQQEQEEEEERREEGAGSLIEGQRTGGGRDAVDQRNGAPVRLVGLLGENLGPSNRDVSTPSSNQNTAAVTGPTDSTNERRETAEQAASSSTAVCPIEGDRVSKTQSDQEPPARGDGAPPVSSPVGTSSEVTGSVSMVTEPENNSNPARSHQHHPQQHLQQPQQSPVPIQRPAQSREWGASILQPPHPLPRPPSQAFHHGPMLAPLSSLGGIRSILGPTPFWNRGLRPAGATLVWGFQQAGRDFGGPGLLGGYHNPARQGGSWYRGGQRGGGFNGM
uniref:protein TASOR n=1 Tax=Semicossyphus pulcher TaxID=241346 RepID=UPI0037E9AD00